MEEEYKRAAYIALEATFMEVVKKCAKMEERIIALENAPKPDPSPKLDQIIFLLEQIKDQKDGPKFHFPPNFSFGTDTPINYCSPQFRHATCSHGLFK